MRLGEGASTAVAVLQGFRDHPGCAWWGDDMSYIDLDLGDVRGHRQLTDAYLVGLAHSHGTQLATFDEGLLALRPAQTLRVP